jgi:hypothetical protein
MVSRWKTGVDSYVILLSVFIALFFVLNEFFDFGLGPAIVIPLSVAIALGLILWKTKVAVSDYVLLPVIIFDGLFHITSPLENLVENSPDWVIAFNLYGGNGMPLIVHQVMGVFLLVTSGWFIYLLVSKKKDWSYYLYKYGVTVVTLTIISFSYLIKLFK